jgi:hypothetical protein
MGISKCQIAEYWMRNVPYSELELNVDIADMPFNCWNCGEDKRMGDSNSVNKTRLERCHIIPKALGGESVPSNYVLLCHTCHRDAPNVNSSTKMWEWIRGNHSNLSVFGINFASALGLFETKKGYSFLTKVVPLIKGDIVCAFKKELTNASYHAFDRMNTSTWLCVLEGIEQNNT